MSAFRSLVQGEALSLRNSNLGRPIACSFLNRVVGLTTAYPPRGVNYVLVAMSMAMACCSDPDEVARAADLCDGCGCAVAMDVTDVANGDAALAAPPSDCSDTAQDVTILVEQSQSFAPSTMVPIEASTCKGFANLLGRWYFKLDWSVSLNPGGGSLPPASIVEFSLNECDPFHIKATEESINFWQWVWPHVSMLDLSSGHYGFVQLSNAVGGMGCAISLARVQDGEFVRTSQLGNLIPSSTMVDGEPVDVIHIVSLSGPLASLVRVKPGD